MTSKKKMEICGRIEYEKKTVSMRMQRSFYNTTIILFTSKTSTMQRTDEKNPKLFVLSATP